MPVVHFVVVVGNDMRESVWIYLCVWRESEASTAVADPATNKETNI